jgi:hypothetical protein
MARTGLRLAVGGVAVLSVVLAVGLFRLRSPQRAPTTGPSPALDSTGSVGRVPHDQRSEASSGAVERERAEEVDGAASLQQQRPEDSGVVPVTAPAVALPRVVEDLKVQMPVFAGAIDSAEGMLAAEERDPLWSPTMETRILSEISQKALGLEITDLQVECRTTICRVQMIFPEQLAHKDFGVVPKGAVWTGQQPISFFVSALDLEFRHVIPGLDRYGTPVLVGYIFKPSTATEPAQPFPSPQC